MVMNVKVPVQASLYWPSLLKEESFDFPLTHVGRKSVSRSFLQCVIFILVPQQRVFLDKVVSLVSQN